MKKVTKGFLEDMTSYCVKHAYHIMINLAEKKLAELDLKVPDFSIMAMVHLNPGITQSQLIDNLYVTRSTASDLVEKLVSRNLILRKPINRKASGLMLSDSGEALFATALANAKQNQQQLSNHLSDTEIKELNRLLLKLADAIE